ncbi:phasin family protein [Rugamonas apoptosis]|uniref:TIGR01841 family phasin n=1 Tax=Rugamonas apoptosis TaxID=2758570 RepID=A0A7W2F7L9_9BURK|nr:phasin family protein [Rugamonas apoptosis]MBA5686605.1 TIGR01841 family phasin [Rugamonas apoptosis]
MFSIPEQFSAATKSQLEAQLNIINNLAAKAVESAEKVIALNISTTKASVEKSSSAAKQLLEAKDPREFFTLSAGQGNYLDNLLAYSRQLFNIASAAQAELIQSAKEQIKDVQPVLTLASPVKPVAVPKAAKAEPEAKAVVPSEPVVEVQAKPAVVAAVPAPAKVEVAAPAKVDAPAAAKVEVVAEPAPVVTEAAPVIKAVASPTQPAPKVSAKPKK